MQLIFRYGFLKLQNIPLALTDWQYLLVLSTVLIAAAYVINIFDQDTDLENKPNRVVIEKALLNLGLQYLCSPKYQWSSYRVLFV
jgi:4-hydroxybenzoate polyprenyltransferase